MKKYIITKLNNSRLLRAVVGGFFGGIAGSLIGLLILSICGH
jgi:hypothetical protein